MSFICLNAAIVAPAPITNWVSHSSGAGYRATRECLVTATLRNPESSNRTRNLPTEFADRTHQVTHYARHLGFPVLTLLIALLGDRKYAKGCRLALRQIEARLNVRTI